MTSRHNDTVSTTATRELVDVLTRITGRQPSTDGMGLRIELDHGTSERDSFWWQCNGEIVSINGGNGRGLLYAVFDLLENLGCVWPGPEAELEQLPRGDQFEIPADRIGSSPSLAGRCLILGSVAFIEDADDWILWAVRNRLNTVFIHVDPPTGGFGAAVPYAIWESDRDRILATLERYELIVEFGGHGLSTLLPRDLFESEPTAFRCVDGVRTADHNLCSSSPFAMKAVREAAEAWFITNPDIDVYHLWPDDLPGGGWCECEECAGLSPADQSLRVTNEIAAVLEDARPGAILTHLAYQDSLDPPTTVIPKSNVALLWAPRQRCYAHTADDPKCPVNRNGKGTGFASLAAWFARHGAAPARVFEYYLDAILFKAIVPPLPTVISGDLGYYLAAGAHTVQALLVGPRRFLSPPINAWLFARLAWDNACDPDQLLDAAARAWQLSPNEGSRYFRAVEAAFRPALDLHPDQGPSPETFAAFLANPFLFLIEQGLPDMDDPERLPVEALTALLTALVESIDHIDDARSLLERGPSMNAAIQREQAELELSTRWLQFTRARAAVYRARQVGSSRATVLDLLESAAGYYAAVIDWARSNQSEVDSDAMERQLWLFWRASLYRIELEELRDEGAAAQVREQRTADVARILMSSP